MTDSDSLSRDDPGAAFARAMAVQWEGLVDRLPLLALGLDRRGNVHFANPHFYLVTGYSPDDVLGHHWFDRFLPEGTRGDLRGVFADVLESEFHPSYENRILDSRGEQMLVRWFNVRLTTPEGQIAGTFSLGHEMARLDHSSDQERSAGDLDGKEVVTVCAWCSRVQDEEDRWLGIAQFITGQLDARVSHGLCPECFGYAAEGKDRRSPR